MDRFTVPLSQVRLADIPQVGGKNASLGELTLALKGSDVKVAEGFAITTAAFDAFLSHEGLGDSLRDVMGRYVASDVYSLQSCGAEARALMLRTELPPEVRAAILAAYEEAWGDDRDSLSLAVRSSATAEDLPQASFAGQHTSLLNVHGKDALIAAVHECFTSLFNDRAIDYRERNGFDHFAVKISVGVQPMVRSDQACSGVIFTLDTESGFRDVVQVTGAYGLGEPIVQGDIEPDEWIVYKPTLDRGLEPILRRRLGSKFRKMVFSDDATVTVDVEPYEKAHFCLRDQEVLRLARAACLIEKHYGKPMDIEWAKDGFTGELFVVQARPETIHVDGLEVTTYTLDAHPGPPLVKGQAVGEAVASGRVRVVISPSDLATVQAGEILVASTTNPDWEPVMKRVAGIVTDQGGRTAHAAIVSREIGLPCVVGAGNATTTLKTGDLVTVSCSEGLEGHVYAGAIPFRKEHLDIQTMPRPRTQVMINIADPAKAFKLSALPHDGVGLARIEFIINNSIGIHPMALARYPELTDQAARERIGERLADGDPLDYFIIRLSEGIAMIAAAMFPRPVIVRTSDFKTNEYGKLLGGGEFEPDEENPMIGFRGASRYYDPRYADGFALECAALLRARDHMGFTNIKIMIPFCRTVEEGKRVLLEMERYGLAQGENGLEVYVMCEIPSNVIEAEEFLKVFDGYSIGSNDLTQLTLGLDRDSGTVSHLFDERDPAVKTLISMAISTARRMGKPIGICGQAPSDYPDFAEWLVREGITSISLNPDALIKTMRVIAEAEQGI